MKLYKLCGGAAFISLITGMASLCGAIEFRTSVLPPLGLLAAGLVLAYIAIKESGGRFDF